jgi:hypothetical protein
MRTWSRQLPVDVQPMDRAPHARQQPAIVVGGRASMAVSPSVAWPCSRTCGHPRTGLSPLQAYHVNGPAPHLGSLPSPHQQKQLDPALLATLNHMHLPAKSEWYMDCGASSHTASALGNVKNLKPSSSYNVNVGNGRISLCFSHWLSNYYLSYKISFSS